MMMYLLNILYAFFPFFKNKEKTKKLKKPKKIPIFFEFSDPERLTQVSWKLAMLLHDPYINDPAEVQLFLDKQTNKEDIKVLFLMLPSNYPKKNFKVFCNKIIQGQIYSPCMIEQIMTRKNYSKKKTVILLNELILAKGHIFIDGAG